jgi:hypothetical protein
MPRLLAVLRLRIGFPGGELECLCEVVRHVNREDSAAWRLPVGYAVQFLELTPALRQAIGRLLMSELPAPPPPSAVDPELKRLLGGHWDSDDWYTLLGIEKDAELSCARRVGREGRARLEQARRDGLPGNLRALLQPALERVTLASLVLGDPLRRAEYDADRGNYRGVARCIAAGLTVSQLESCRKRHQAAHPAAGRDARACVTRARALEAARKYEEASSSFKHALCLDPLDLELHLIYAAFKSRRQSAAMDRREPTPHFESPTPLPRPRPSTSASVTEG